MKKSVQQQRHQLNSRSSYCFGADENFVVVIKDLEARAIANDSCLIPFDDVL